MDQRRDRSRSRSSSPESSDFGNSPIRGRKRTSSVSPARRSMSVERVQRHLKEIFGSYGEIKKISYPMHPNTGYPVGKAVIEFSSEDAVKSSISSMNGGQIDGNHIVCAISETSTPFVPYKYRQEAERNIRNAPFRSNPNRYIPNPRRRSPSRSLSPRRNRTNRSPPRRISPSIRRHNRSSIRRRSVSRSPARRRSLSRSPTRRRSPVHRQLPSNRLSPSPSRRRASFLRSPSPARARPLSRSPIRYRSPIRKRTYSRSPSFSRSPPRRKTYRNNTYSRSRSRSRSRSPVGRTPTNYRSPSPAYRGRRNSPSRSPIPVSRINY